MASGAESPRLLLTGTSGQVGGELLRTLNPLGVVIAPSRSEMDLADTASVRSFIRETRPRWIVNAAAYTAVDKAESEESLAYAINADAVRAMGLEARALGATVLHFSTDYVFDGRSPKPYIETDRTNPLSVYGASKLAGEQALAETGAASLIFRTSWVYGTTGRNFLRTILRLARERDELRVVDDQHGAPTWSRDLARMTAHIIALCESTARRGDTTPDEAIRPLIGVYHAAGSGETTWAGFAAEAVRRVAEREPSASLASIRPITTAEFPTSAARPANSRMSNAKLLETFGWRMMTWQESLGHVLDELD